MMRFKNQHSKIETIINNKMMTCLSAWQILLNPYLALWYKVIWLHVFKKRELVSSSKILNLMLLVAAYLANTKSETKNLKNDWNPDIWVLIWEYTVRAFQTKPTWQGLNGFQKSLCPLDRRSHLRIGRVRNHHTAMRSDLHSQRHVFVSNSFEWFC